MLRLFAGSESGHGYYDPSRSKPRSSGGKIEIKSSARTLRGPATGELWERHLRGDRPLGVIPIRDDSTCLWGCIDVDDYNLDLSDLAGTIDKRKLPLIVCRSKSGGAHVFLFLSEPADAGELLDALRSTAASLGHGKSEIFPKQRHVKSDAGDQGNWIVMPYFGETETYALRRSGAGLTLTEFLSLAERSRIRLSELDPHAGIRRSKKGDDGPVSDGFEDGPPCLEHLTAAGFPEGTRNNGLFALGVLAKKKFGDKWKEVLEEYNRLFMRPPLSADEVRSIIRGLEKKDYNYRCSDVPCVNHCDAVLCRTRRFGVGDQGSFPTISGLSVLDTVPPLWFMDIDGERVEMSTDDLQNYRRFHKVCMERLRVCFNLLSQERWLKMVSLAMDTVTVIEAPPEVSTLGRFHELLTDFCRNKQVGRVVEDLYSGRPYEDQEKGVHYLRLRDLHDYVEREKFPMGRNQLSQRLRDLGSTPLQLNIRDGSVRVWAIPTQSLDQPPPRANKRQIDEDAI